jgi:hypothetical protein
MSSVDSSLWTQSSARSYKFITGFGERFIFKFPNRYKRGTRVYWKYCCIPAIPDKGLCGGMSLAVKTYFTFNKLAPDAPYPNEALLEFIARCQLDTLTISALYHYFAFMLTSREKDQQMVRNAWLKVKESVDQDKPILIGLICEKAPYFNFYPGLLRHHQVLVYGYEIDNEIIYLRVYDPKHPKEGKVQLFFKEDGSGLDCTENLKRLYKKEEDFDKEPQLLPEKRIIYTFFPVDCDVSRETLECLPT